MSKYYYTSKELLASVKRRIIMPTSQSTLTDQDLLDFATEEINMAMVPMMQNQQEDYFLITEDITLVQGKTTYEIPYRATGNKIREVSFLRPGSNDIYELTRIGVGDLPFYNRSQASGPIGAFYMSNNEICLVASPDSMSGSLRVSYYIRPNVMVPLEEVAVISNIDRNTGIITVTSIPEKWLAPNGTLLPDQLFDFITIKSPHKTLKYDVEMLSVDSGSITVTFSTSNIPESLTKGDHIALATETAIPQIPSDLHVMLAHRVATRCLEAMGDTEGLQNANTKLAEMQQAAKDLTENRVEDAPKKIVPRHGVLRNGLTRRNLRRGR